MRPCLLVSVPHTGTRLLRTILGEAGYHATAVQSPWVAASLEPDEYVVQHAFVERREQFLTDARAGLPIIAPLRHPATVHRSWQRRGKPVHSRLHRNSFYSYWDVFLSAVAPHAHIVAIDTPERDAQLQAVAEALGAPLTTDWPRIGAQGKTDDSHLWSPPLERLWDEHSDFFERFYRCRRA